MPQQVIPLLLIPETCGLSDRAPEIYADTPDVEADEGYFVTLSCSARGSPQPTILWTRGGATVSWLFDKHSFIFHIFVCFLQLFSMFG